MRGKLVPTLFVCVAVRITPAHAGKTRSRSRKARPRTDHPRACGENCSTPPMRTKCSGSPPRMRGKRKNGKSGAIYRRITPAHAGKTLWSLRRSRAPKDHPRACGENSPGLLACLAACGSPPRMRGKHPKTASIEAADRITPAHAGKTAVAQQVLQGCTDHPRACGENTFAPADKALNPGSPPRMRGKLTAVFARPSQLRITPAHAGKT